MAATFTQIYIQYVFTVKGRSNLLLQPWREEVFKYISGIIKGKGQKSIIVNGVSDQVHVFAGIKPTIIISDLIRDIKNNSSNFINDHQWLKGKFSWQEGYGAFSYSHSQIDSVYRYIANQEKYHQRISFKEEYLELLQKFDIPFEDKYLFEWIQ